MLVPTPTPGGLRRGITTPFLANNAPYRSGLRLVFPARRTRRDDFELESSREEKDRAYMHDSQNRDTGMGAGYAFPREQGPLHIGVSVSQRGNEAHDYRGDMNGPGIQAFREPLKYPLSSPPGVGLSVKAESSSPYSSSNLSRDWDLCHHLPSCSS
jgi:hypothetical protein